MNIGRIKRGLGVMGFVVDVVRGVLGGKTAVFTSPKITRTTFRPATFVP